MALTSFQKSQRKMMNGKFSRTSKGRFTWYNFVAFDKLTTSLQHSCKSNLQLAYDCRVRHEECRGLLKHALRPIYTVQLCRMRYAYDKSTTRIVSCKSNLQLACDCRVRHEECRGLLKHVLKPYDNCSDRQGDIMEIVYDFFMTRAARATKIACDNRKQNRTV